MPKTAKLEKKGLDNRQKVESNRLEDEKNLHLEQEKFNESKNARSSTVEKDWLVADAMYRGYHNIKWNDTRGTIVFDSSDPLGMYVNLIKSTVRAVRNAVLRQRPEWDVDAEPYGEISDDTRQVLGNFLTNLYDELDLESTMKKAVKNGLITGKGWLQYGYEEGEDGMGELYVESYNTFDIYPDPFARCLDDLRYIVKVVRKPLDEIKSNPRYKNTDKLTGSEKTTESPYKELLNAKLQQSNGSKAGLIHEMWIKQKGEDGQNKIMVITTCNGVILRADEAPGYDDLPFIYYEPETDSDEMNSAGWVKDLVPLNKAINYNERNILEYIHVMVKGRFVKDKNAKVSVVTNENGKIISKTRGSEFTQLPIAPLPSTPFNQISNLVGYMNDIGAAPEALRGIAPTGVTAARALEDLVANAYNSLSDPIDNVINTLSTLAERLLRLLYNFQAVRKQFKFKVDGKEKVFFIVGKDGTVGEGEENVVMLPENPRVKVSIISGVAYTKSAKEETMMKLYSMQLVDKKTVQETFGLNTEKIQQRMDEQMMKDMAMAQGQAPQEEQVQEQGTEQGQPVDVTMVVPQEIYDMLTDAGKGLVEDFAMNNLRLDTPFIDNPQLIESLAAGQLEYNVGDDGLVMVGAEQEMQPEVGVMGQ
jgi:hypothetical protein